MFKHWSLLKLQNFNKELTLKTYNPGDFIYRQGDDSSVFYIIKRGSVQVDTVIEVDEYNRYPIGPQKWEIVKTTKKIRYKVKELGKS